jgi:uncharacterized protein YyaL (SSP411 family)
MTGGIDWQPWSYAAFRRAAEERSLVLLSITATWSRGCERMMRETYADPGVVAAVAAHCVPIIVDADERPDIAERYALDGWPTTLLLTPDGEILNGVTFAVAETLVPLVERTAALYSKESAVIATRADRARHTRATSGGPIAQSDANLPHTIATALLTSADESRGGFTEHPRFVHGEALLFLLRYGLAAGDARGPAHARHTIEAILESPMFDPARGISRCANDRDWGDPAGEYEAATQAAVLRVCAEGSAAGFGQRWRDDAERLADCVGRRWLWPAEGHPPYTDAAADSCGAALLWAAALENAALGRQAIAALEQALLASYRPGAGLRHRSDPGAPRLLLDHALAIDALLEAKELTGELPYSMLAEELGWYLIDHFADPVTGAFRDRVHDDDPIGIGRLSEPCHPFRGNALAARALARLSVVSGESRFGEAAAASFAWTAGRWPRHGIDAAACGLAALDLIDWRLSGPSEGRHTTR